MIVYANILASRIGYVAQASFEIMRQLWLLMFVFYECFNGAVQAMVASSFGTKDWARARAIFVRCLQFACFTAAAVSAVAFPLQGPGIRMISQDPAVFANVKITAPLLLCSLPLDALTLICDGVLLAG